jgi:hypothetical protein
MPRKKADDKSHSIQQSKGKTTKAVRGLLAGNDPAPLRLRPTRKADATYPLKLTRPQRESMIR